MSVLSFVRGVSAVRSCRQVDWPGGLAEPCIELSVQELRSAYARGFYLSLEAGRQTWRAPEMRMVLSIDNFHIEPAVRRRLARKDFRVTFDQDFSAVVQACAVARAGRMDEGIVAAFISAFDAGLAHSVEIWDRSGSLAGGIFGLSIGNVFFTEGHFARARDASKVGFSVLNCHLQRWAYLLNDGKHLSGRLCQLGFLPIERAAFNALLAMGCTRTGQDGRWSIDQTLNLVAWNPRAMSALH